MNVIQTLSLLKKLIVVFKILLTVNMQQIKEIIGAEYVLTDMTSILTWNFVLVVKQFNSNVYQEFQTVTNFTDKVSICVKLVLVGLLNLLMKRTVQLRYKIVNLLRMLLTPNYVVNVWVDFLMMVLRKNVFQTPIIVLLDTSMMALLKNVLTQPQNVLINSSVMDFNLVC